MRFDLRAVGLCIAVVSQSACAPSVEAVRASAARALACPGENVDVRWQADLDYSAAGCGRATYLRCSARRDGECRVVADAPGSIPAGALVDPSPPEHAWAELSLSVVGPARDGDTLHACIDEAHAAGVRLRQDAAAKATLYLGSDGNRVTLADNTTSRSLGQWNPSAVCRAAIAAVVAQDRVRVTRSNEPTSCREVGVVEGRDQQWGALPSYEAALASLQLAAARLGADVVVLDAMREGHNQLLLNGRAFECRHARPLPSTPDEKEI